MRAEAVSWDDWTVSNAPPVVEDDKWHVALAPGEVKVVSLEQLDDLFRLSIVDAETKVWQNGMTDWQPLRVIAGIEDEPAAPPPPKRTHPKPPSPRSAPPAPRSAAPSVRPAPPAQRPPAPPPRSVPPSYSAPPPPQSARPAAQSARPAPRSAPPPYSAPPAARSAPPPYSAPPAPRSAPPRALSVVPASAPPASFYPVAVGIAPAATAPLSFTAPVAPLPLNSVRPLVVSRAPMPAERSGGFGRYLVGLALVAGAGVSLYRNDVLRDGAHSAHQDALYARLEAALGGPAFGTPRALELGLGASLPSASDTVPSMPAGLVADSTSPSSPATLAAAGLQPSRSTPPVVSLESIAPEKKALAVIAPTTPAAVTPPAVRSVAPAGAAAARPAASHVKSAPAARVEKPAPAPEKSDAKMSERERLNAAIGRSMSSTPPSSTSKSKSKASEYDPLNPKL